MDNNYIWFTFKIVGQISSDSGKHWCSVTWSGLKNCPEKAILKQVTSGQIQLLIHICSREYSWPDIKLQSRQLGAFWKIIAFKFKMVEISS